VLAKRQQLVHEYEMASLKALSSKQVVCTRRHLRASRCFALAIMDVHLQVSARASRLLIRTFTTLFRRGAFAKIRMLWGS
jgi:hypothetical protein